MFSGNAKINYLSTLAFDDEVLSQFGAAANSVEIVQITANDAADVPPEVWAQVDVLHTSSVLPRPEYVPRLQWIQLDTSGVDHVRPHPIWNSSAVLTTIGGISPVPLAEYVIWSILGMAHRLPELLEVRDTRQWPSPSERWRRMLPAPLRGSTLVIVGYGRIGREIGRIADTLGMSVVGVSRTGVAAPEQSDQFFDFAPNTSQADIELVGTDLLMSVLPRADYLVIVVPLTAATANLIDAAAVTALKPGAVVVNVARGGIIDEEALRAGLRSGQIAGAVLDVFDDEPLGPEHPWWNEPTVFVTPHVSGFAPQYSRQVIELVTENLRRFTEGQPLMNVVDRSQGY
ncbi:D-2-hydroxyacid dehydrogenase [Glaciihabitans sp. UYNi722]|uniref:D-2-hydroxyacid dehydrogenase n=1 Tax=Glaciihabitans sp. UYNi722 TaxID=3156344 RepID=UPI003396AD18